MCGKRFALSWRATTGRSAAPIAHASLMVVSGSRRANKSLNVATMGMLFEGYDEESCMEQHDAPNLLVG